MNINTRGIRISLFPLFLILALCSIGMSAAETTVTVSPSAQDVDVGQTFTITIDVTPGEAIDKVQADLIYDQNLVTATSIADGGMFANFVSDSIDNTNGKIESICGFNLGGATTTNPGTLATVTFTANTVGQSSLDLVDVIVLNGVTPIPNDPQSGSVTVNPVGTSDTIVKVSPSTQDVYVGQTFTITIDATPGEAIDKVQADLIYDQNLVTATSIADGGMFANFVSDSIDNTNGKIESICGFNLGGATTTNPGTLATVTFTANTVGQSSLDLVDVIVLNGVTPVPNDPQSGSVTVTDNDPPTVTVTYPVSGTVSGTIVVTADADDSPDGSVAQVAFYLMPAGTLIGTDTNAAGGWSCPLDTTTAADGTGYRIKAVATDDEGATGDDTGGVFAIDNACTCDFCLDLEAGLNFVSIPKTLVDSPKNATTVFDVDYYTGEFCLYYDTSAGSFDLNADVKPCRGFLVYKNAAKSICVDFDDTAPAPSQQLYVGWNMIGHIKPVAMPINDGTTADFVSITGLEEPEGNELFRLMATYTGTGWSEYPSGSLTDVTPGAGYWIYMNHDVVMSGGFE